ncbi:hypothetical protein ATER59S_02464 [Aquamicrobium terrae]|jgi:hypothetical protein
MRDIAHNIDAMAVFQPAILSATDESDPIDLLGFNSAAIIVSTGAIAGSGNFTAKIQHSDDGDDSPPDWDDVEATHLHGALPAVLAANECYRIGYAGSRRWLRVVITKNSGTSIGAGVIVIKGDPHSAPVTA